MILRAVQLWTVYRQEEAIRHVKHITGDVLCQFNLYILFHVQACNSHGLSRSGRMTGSCSSSTNRIDPSVLSDPAHVSHPTSILATVFWVSVSLMESDFEFEYQMSLRLVHKLLSKVNHI